MSEQPDLDPAVEAVQAAVRALVVAGHRLLDAVDALVDDPQRLRSTLEATSGWVQRLAEAVPAVAPTARRGGRNGVEHIEIDDG